MALQAKLRTKVGGFVPIPLQVLDVRRRLKVATAPINWPNLTEEQYWQQWGSFLNTMHLYNTANIINTADMMPVFVQYLRIRKYNEAQIETIRDASENDLTFSIVSKVYLLMTTGVDHPAVAQTDKWITQKLKALLASSAAKQAMPDLTKRTAEDRKRDKRSELLGELQGLEDEMGEVDILQFLTEKAVAKEHLDRIIEMFEPRLNELKEVLTTKDEQLKEAYSNYRKPEILKMIEWYERLLRDVAAYRNVKLVRKHFSKPKPPEKVVARLKYKVADNKLNINSVNAKKLVGATSAWLYNTKTRKLIVYYASDYEKQLTVKGTYIVGWDPNTSMSKTLRWPEEQLSEFMKTIGKVAQRTFLQDIKAKQSTLNGKVNTDMLILKVA